MPSTDVSAGLARGTQIGRHVLLEQIGSGGMGQIYRAYDPQLDRSIAVKLLHPSRGGRENDSEGRARLMREAQALARLTHPNVVVVYDFGAFRDQFFIAMEYVDGSTVKHWLHSNIDDRRSGAPKTDRTKSELSSPDLRPWQEVVRVFLSAGEGLAAAHRVGIVHRDFKSENVMIGRDGSVRVMDFGLARQIAVTDAKPADQVATAAQSSARSARILLPADDGDPSGTRRVTYESGVAHREIAEQSLRTSRPFDAALTQDGAFVGTALYTAPEQYAGETGNERSDQFSFSASLYEALYGKPPFSGQGLVQLSTNILRGILPDAPEGTKVPAWVRKVVLRGLSNNPDDRYPSMEALLADLRTDPTVARRRRRRTVAATVAVLLLVGGVGVAARQTTRRAPCEGAAEKLAGIWVPAATGSARQQAIHAAFIATGKGYAERTYETVGHLLDQYTSAWTTMHRDACEATAVRKEQSNEVLDLRMSCLQRRLDSVKALTDVFVRADGETVERAASAVNSLGPLESCADVAVLRSVVQPPDDPAVRAHVQRLKPRLAEVKALTDAGHANEALAKAKPLADEARGIAYEPIVAESLYRLGALSFGDPAEAEGILDEAVRAALGGRDEELFVEAAICKSYVIGYLRADPVRARPWIGLAESMLRGLTGHDILRAWLANDQGILLFEEGRNDDAISALKRALILKEKVLGPNHPDVALTLGNLADALLRAGRAGEALELNERARTISERAIGSEHPSVAMLLSSQGEYLNALSRFSDAEAPARQALGIWERGLVPEHPFLAFALTVLGRSYLGRGRTGDAIPFLERAYAIRERDHSSPSLVGETAFALAQAVWHGQPSRAVNLAVGARDAYATTKERATLALVEQWLRDHGRPTTPIASAR